MVRGPLAGLSCLCLHWTLASAPLDHRNFGSMASDSHSSLWVGSRRCSNNHHRWPILLPKNHMENTKCDFLAWWFRWSSKFIDMRLGGLGLTAQGVLHQVAWSGTRKTQMINMWVTGAPSSFLLLLVRHLILLAWHLLLVASLLLVVRHGAPNSVLAPGCDALCS